MCRCTPEIRTPFCGRGDCLPPASREPTESLFAANAEREFARMAHGDHLAQFKADQLDAWERRIGVEVLTELRQSRAQADALAGALEATKQTAGQLLVLKEATGVIPADLAEVFVSRACEMAAAALRAYREATP